MQWKKLLIGEQKHLRYESSDGTLKTVFTYRSGLLPNLAVIAVIVALIWWLVC